MGKQICGPCGKEFDTRELYLDHECEAAEGAKPGTPEYLKLTTTPNYDKVAEAAIARGAQA